MTPLSYIDLHCDTAYELYRQKQHLSRNALAISAETAAPFDRYAQCFAIWCDKALSDEDAWLDFLRISDHFAAQLDTAPAFCPARTGKDLARAWQDGRHAAFLAVEDARLLGGKLERLDELARRGVVYLTLTWQGQSCIGGAWDTEMGLSDFGREVIARCFARGIVPDLSHASEQTADDVLDMAEAAGKPVIATHSGAYSVYAHPRNLRDRHVRRIAALGGVVGVTLCRYHLCDDEERAATVEDVARHIEHFLSLGTSRQLCIGGDLDGAPLPQGIETLANIPKIADTLRAHGIEQEIVQDIFAHNARNFIQTNFK